MKRQIKAASSVSFMDVNSGWYFIHANISKRYDFMCNYNIEWKQVLEKKRLASNKFYYYLHAS